MELIRGQICIQVQSLVDGVLIAAIPSYATGESVEGRTNKAEIYKYYSDMGVSGLLKNLSIVIDNPITGITYGDLNSLTRKIQIFDHLGKTYLCLNENFPNFLTFFS
jgi:hypothetical protein